MQHHDGAELGMRPEQLGIGRLFDRVPDAIVVASVDTGRVVLWNPAAERLFGYAADEAVGQCIEDLLVPDHLRSAHESGIDNFRRTGRGRLIDTQAPVEVPARRKDGGEVPVELTLSPLDDVPGDRRYVLALIRDATARRQAEADRSRLAAAEAAAAERARLEAVLHQMPVAVLIAEAPHGRVAYANARVAELLGGVPASATPAEAPGAPRGFRHGGEPYLPAEWPLVRALVAGEIVADEEIELVWPDGARRILSVAASPIRDPDGLIVAAVATFADVSEQRRSRERLRVLADASAAFGRAGLEASAVLEALVRSVAETLGGGSAVRVLSPDGRWLRHAAVHHADPEALALMQRAMDAAPLRADDESSPAQLLKAEAPLLLPRLTDEDVRRIFPPEYWPYHERYRIRSLLVAPLRARGRALGTLGAVRDGEDRPFTPEDAELLRDLADRAAAAVEGARLYEELRHEVALRDQIVGTVSHDMGAPLTAIRGHSQMLRRRLKREGTIDPERLDAALAHVESSGARISSMVQELVDTARMRAGHALELRLGRVDLVALARRAVEQRSTTSSSHPIAVVSTAEELLGLWDEARLQRVLDNLVENATKYSPPGTTVTLRLAREDTPSGPVARLAVEDQGIGIPASDLPRVFEPFYRASNAADRATGTGLGLAGARQIVELHGGTVEVQSAEGRGSTFTVRLPLAGGQ